MDNTDIYAAIIIIIGLMAFTGVLVHGLVAVAG